MLRKTTEHGFTLVEVMIVLAIVDLLASISLGSYQRQVAKAKMTEAVVLLGSLRTEVLAGAAMGDFPNQAGSSVARVPRERGGTKRAPGDMRIVRLPESKFIRNYAYEVRPGAKRAWIEVRLERRQVDGCGGQCKIHWGFQRNSSGQLKEFCGTWTAGRNFRFPADVLPSGCDSTCVRCDLNNWRRS